MSSAPVCAALLLLAGCATVKSHQVRPDYEQVDKRRVKRLAVITHPLPEGAQPIGDLWSLVARRYVNQKRDFIAKTNTAVESLTLDVEAVCVEGVEGILALNPTVRRQGEGVEAAVRARLLRCTDGDEVWSAEAAGSWSSADDKFKGLRQQYVEELGPEVEPYVAPTFQLLKATLDTLPNPALDEEDISEKIELGE